jgi:WD40 repeat protein
MAVFCCVDGTLVSPLFPLDYAAQAVCITKDESTIYVGGDDHKIHIYSVSQTYDLAETGVIENGHLKPVHALALSHDQTKLASADVRDVCVWNVAEDNTPLVTKGRWCFHTQRITCLAWSKDDSVLASGGADDSIYLWSLSKKTKRVHYPFCHRGGVTGLEFVGEWRLLSVGVDACVNQWDVAGDVSKKFG